MQRLAIDLPRHPVRHQRLQLRTEHETVTERRVVERLDPQPVADEHERLPRLIPERDGEHSAQVLDEVRTVLLVEVNDDFRVGVGGESVPAGLQIRAEIPIIVDLAVEHDPDRSVLVRERLMAPREVDDAEPPHPEAHRAVYIDAVIIRTPVGDRLAHRPDDARIDPLVTVFIELPGYAAHVGVILFPKMGNGFPKIRSCSIPHA